MEEEVRMIMFFGLMIISLILSIGTALWVIIKTHNFWQSTIIGTVITITILGCASYWWFETDTDGISAGLGVIYYLIAMGVTILLNFIVLSVYKSKRIQG
ncbi:hypothetical protein GCM10008967_30120 [Bacillus carboniphilus]|uniref:YesK-like protein n=1 Tax=Bacillus carboniphilus TaxID=86663 RepID=A0ABP3G858_9BACI